MEKFKLEQKAQENLFLFVFITDFIAFFRIARKVNDCYIFYSQEYGCKTTDIDIVEDIYSTNGKPCSSAYKKVARQVWQTLQAVA